MTSLKEIIIRFRVSFHTLFDWVGLQIEYGLCFSGMLHGVDCLLERLRTVYWSLRQGLADLALIVISCWHFATASLSYLQGSSSPTFQDCPFLCSLRVRHALYTAWPLKIWSVGCPETLEMNHQSTLQISQKCEDIIYLVVKSEIMQIEYGWFWRLLCCGMLCEVYRQYQCLGGTCFLNLRFGELTKNSFAT